MNRLFQKVLRLFAAPRIDVREDYEKMRQLQRQMAALPPQLYKTLDREIVSTDGSHIIPGRVFLPKEQTRDDLLLFFHGGGWVTGDIDSYTPACAAMADLTGCIVVSVDYRLAPEHPFPAGLDDCYQVTKLLLDDPQLANIDDPEKIVLIGDSAGGNLAAAVSLRLRDEHHRGASRQILLYPVTYWDHKPETSPYASVRDHGDDYRLTDTEVQEYMELYVPDPEKRQDKYVAPLMATDLSDQPQTLMITAELDLLRDEGEAYAVALAEAGNEVRTHRVNGALHGFISLPRFARTLREGYEVINEFLDGVRESAESAADAEDSQ